jgi:hypothetical protein
MKATSARPLPTTQIDSVRPLKEVLHEVERDEAEAISLLVNLLEKVRKTSHTEPLEEICKVVNEWQHQPPGGIVTSLKKVAEEFEQQCPAHAKR